VSRDDGSDLSEQRRQSASPVRLGRAAAGVLFHCLVLRGADSAALHLQSRVREQPHAHLRGGGVLRRRPAPKFEVKWVWANNRAGGAYRPIEALHRAGRRPSCAQVWQIPIPNEVTLYLSISGLPVHQERLRSLTYCHSRRSVSYRTQRMPYRSGGKLAGGFTSGAIRPRPTKLEAAVNDLAGSIIKCNT